MSRSFICQTFEHSLILVTTAYLRHYFHCHFSAEESEAQRFRNRPTLHSNKWYSQDPNSGPSGSRGYALKHDLPFCCILDVNIAVWNKPFCWGENVQEPNAVWFCYFIISHTVWSNFQEVINSASLGKNNLRKRSKCQCKSEKTNWIFHLHVKNTF